MKSDRPIPRPAAAAWLLLLLAAPASGGHFAATVTDYHPGAAVTLTNPYSATGQPGDIVGAGSGFDSVLSLFNPHYEASQLAQIGEGGELTLRLERGVQITAGFPEVGIFTNSGLIDGDFPNGLATGAFGSDTATIDVSADGMNWASLGAVTCDFPSSAFSDAPSPFHPDTTGLTPSDYGKPHSLQLSDLDGKTHAEILTLLDGSAGGTWLDLDETGLAEIAYVRFRVPDDGDAQTQNTFELAAVSINSTAAGPAPVTLTFIENFATDPIGTRATGDAVHVSYSRTARALSASYDLGAASARTSWPLGQSLTDQTSFTYCVDFTIEELSFAPSAAGQISFGLINATTTGNNRTASPGDAYDILTVDYFPSEDFATFTPTVIGSQQAGQTDAFARLGFPSGSASLINEPGEVGQLPTGTPLSTSVDYDAATRTLTLRLNSLAINAFGPNPDGDDTTVQYTIPASITFSVDTFAILCWEQSDGGTAELSFSNLAVTTPAPAPNYYTWADSNITHPQDRETGADHDANGLTNLVDYALGNNRPTTSTTGDDLILRWQQLPARRDVTVTAQSSSDLRNWIPVAHSVISAGPAIELLRAKASRAGVRQFLRLEVTRP